MDGDHFLKTIYGNILTLFVMLSLCYSYSQSSFWTKVSEEKMLTLDKMERSSMPSKYNLYSLNTEAFKIALLNAPLENSDLNSNLIIQFPGNYQLV